MNNFNQISILIPQFVALLSILAVASAGVLPVHQHHYNHQYDHSDSVLAAHQHGNSAAYNAEPVQHQQPIHSMSHLHSEPAHYAAPALVKPESSHEHYQHTENVAPAKYEYSWSVQEDNTKDIKQQHETHHGDKVNGQYSLLESDGYHKVVDYSADAHSGFQAVVHREPTAQNEVYQHKFSAPSVAHYTKSVGYEYRVPKSYQGYSVSEYQVPKAHEGIPAAVYGIPSTHQEPATVYGVPKKTHQEYQAIEYHVPKAHQGFPAAEYGVPSAHQEYAGAAYRVPKSYQGFPAAEYGVPSAHQSHSKPVRAVSKKYTQPIRSAKLEQPKTTHSEEHSVIHSAPLSYVHQQPHATESHQPDQKLSVSFAHLKTVQPAPLGHAPIVAIYSSSTDHSSHHSTPSSAAKQSQFHATTFGQNHQYQAAPLKHSEFQTTTHENVHSTPTKWSEEFPSTDYEALYAAYKPHKLTEHKDKLQSYVYHN